MSQNGNSPRRGRHRARTHRIRDTAAATASVAMATGIVVAATGSARADIDWEPIIACESGGNPAAQNPSSTASGLFQFLDSSWAAYGGLRYASRAKYATPAQQYAVANAAYAQSGVSPWAASRACWGGKVSTTGPRHAAPPAPSRLATPAELATPPKHALPKRPAPWTGPTTPYTVVSGDTLASIAARHNLSGWLTLWAANSTISNPDLIFTGQTIRIPAPS
jgi:resuscitation-promoting factor RpfA